MHIVSLDFKNFRGLSSNIKFSKYANILTSPNGGGKTTTLELLAVLSGHKDAKKLIHPRETIDYAEIVIDSNGYKHTLKLEDGFDFDKIDAFKDTLPTLTSFVLQESLHDNSLVTEQREPVECQKDLLAWMDMHDMKVNAYVREGYGVDMLVSETGAQRYLLTVGIRRAPTATPMLIESPERHLHLLLRRSIVSFYEYGTPHQTIVTTHCPTVYALYSSHPSSKKGKCIDLPCSF